ncbi:MAG: DUF456 domain-containing protein [Thermoguttaceae bacterium]
MAILITLLLVVVLMGAWLLTLLGLPGNWLMVIAAAVHACFVPADSSLAIGWKVVVALLGLAVFGEVVELLAAMAGTSKAGGSKRGAILAIIGSIAGGIIGVTVGLPIPVVGPVLAAVLFAGVGAMAGAMLGERWAGKDATSVWRVGRAAFVGRLTGTLGKLLVGGVMIAVVVLAILF